MTGERLYHALLFLYPRRFRREYRDPMLQLYRDARREHSSSWPRLAGDVVMSVPVQHKEALRAMSTQTKLVALALVVATGVVVFAAIGGAFASLALMILLAWVLISLLRARGARPSEGFWWKLMLSGVGILAFAVVFFGGPWPDSWRDAVPGELAWWSGFVLVAFALVMIFAGLFTGIAGRASRRRLTP
jgi:hypothetical protein